MVKTGRRRTRSSPAARASATASPLDAIHLAAVSLRTSLSAFVTYDKRLAAAAQEIGLPVLSPG
ncbi:MAG TPA: hypothetical protein VF223_21890 [Trebonia sp.]|jgi:uncharacterized protein